MLDDVKYKKFAEGVNVLASLTSLQHHSHLWSACSTRDLTCVALAINRRNLSRGYSDDTVCSSNSSFLVSCIACNTMAYNQLLQSAVELYHIGTAYSSHQPFLASCIACNILVCHQVVQSMAEPYRIDTASPSQVPFLVSCIVYNIQLHHLFCRNLEMLYRIDTVASSHSPFVMSCNTCSARPYRQLRQTLPDLCRRNNTY